MREVSPEWLMTFLAVARLGRYTAAAQVLGVNHSTVSRRIASLENAMGDHLLVSSSNGWELTPLGHRALATAEHIERELSSLTKPESQGLTGLVRIAAPDAFGAMLLTPALATLQEKHRGLDFEIISATRRVRQHRSGVDIEIGIGKPLMRHVVTVPLHRYSLGLYASPSYLAKHGTPVSVEDIARHRLIYYVAAELQVDDLDHAYGTLPNALPSIRSTGVFSHLTSTSAGAGIGLLPDFLAATDPTLVRVLTDEYEHHLQYWAVTREETLRGPAVVETLRAIMRTCSSEDAQAAHQTSLPAT